MQRLKVGKLVPEIEGEDLEGAKFKLGDYRGKVTVLIFWAGQMPDENELCARFAGRPFALVGVNGDEVRADAQSVVKRQAIPWRSFWNGERGADGPIAMAWNVLGWPEVYVIDHAGVIRYKNLRGDELHKPLEELVAAAEAAGTSK